MLFIGIDDNEHRNQGNARADALVLATYQKDAHSVKLISIPRDSYVYVPKLARNTKIAHAHAFGGVLETVETEAKALSCEVAMVFLDERVSPQAIEFFESQGYERQEQDELFSVWREVSLEFLQENMFMMVKKLREKRIMRPL